MMRQCTVIIIDDEVNLAANLRDIIEEEGHLVDTAFDGASGLALCREKMFDVALIDIRLPDMSGHEVAGKIAEFSPMTGCVLITGHASLESAVEAVKQESVVAYEIKPLDIGRMLILLKEIVKRRQAEEELQESERKYCSVVEQAQDAIIIVQDGVFKFVNARMSDFTKHTVEELVGMEFVKTIDPDAVEIVKERVARRIAGEDVPNFYETKLLDKTGQKMTVEVNARVIEYQGRPADLVFLRDITERKRAEDALRESEERYRRLVESSPDAILVHSEGKVVFANLVAAKLLGVADPKELIGKPAMDFVHPDYRDIAKGRVQSVYEDGQQARLIEERFVRLDGQSFDVEVAAARITFMGKLASRVVFRDITERKRADETLRESEEKYRHLVERANDGIAIVQDSLLKYVNPRLAEIVGHAVDEMIETPYADYVWPDELSKVAEHYERRMAGEDVTPVYETALGHRDGRRVDVELNAGIITYREKPADFVFIRDVTERKRAEEALRESRARLYQVVQNMPVMMNALDENGNIIAWNQECERVTGYSADEMINNPRAMELLYPDPAYLQRMMAEWSERGGDYRDWEWEITCKDKSVKTVAWFNISQQFPIPGWAQWGTGVDVTERKRVEEALRTRERFLECLSEVSQELLRASDVTGVLPIILRCLGETAEVSRTYLFENHLGLEGELLCSQRYEWCAPGVEPQMDNPDLQNFSYVASGFSHWAEALAQGDIVVCSTVDAPESGQPLLECQDIHSLLIIPVFVSDYWYGFIGFDVCDQVRGWQQVEVDLLRAVASAIASGIERERARQQALALAEATAALTTTLDFEQVLDRILEQVSCVVPNDATNIMLIEDDQARIVRWRGYERFGAQEFVSTVVFHVPEVPNFQQMVETGEPVVISDVATYREWVHVPVQEWLRSYAAAPIVVRGEVIGFLSVDSATPGFFTPVHAEALRAFADHAAAAIANARLFKQAQRRLRSLVSLNQASQVIAASLDVKEVLKQVVSLAGSVVNSDYTSVVLVDDQGDPILGTEDFRSVPPITRRIRSRGVNHRVLDSGQPVVVDTISGEGEMSPPLRQPDGGVMAANPDIVAAGIRSFAAVPIQAKGKTLGVLFAHSRRPRAFHGQVPLLTTFANHAAVALENARLFETTQQRVAELEALRQASLSLTSSLEPEAVLEAILESTMALLSGVQDAHLFLYQDGRLTFGVALWAGGRKGQPLAQPRPHGLTYTVARQGEVILVPDMRTHPLFADAPSDWEGAIVGLPLKIGRRVIGVMNIAYQQPRVFTEAELRLLRLLASQAAIAIENARLYEEAQLRVRELGLINRISAEFGAALNADTTINHALEGLHELVKADRTYFVTTGADARTWETTHERVAPGIKPDIGLTGALDDAPVELETLLSGQPLAVSDVTTDPRVEASREMYRSLDIQSILLVPVQVGERLYGALGFDYCRERHVWQPDEMRLLETVAHQLELALDNARLFQETRQRADELAVALARQEELDRLKDQFIQNVSHELRSPLALIRGYAEMLDTGELGELQPEQRDSVAVIARRARMLGDLVQDITLILEAEVSPPKPGPVPLDELVQAAVEDFQVVARQAGLTLHAETAPHLSPVSGSHIYLRRVLDNLIGNAVKFTSGGGTITVRLRQKGKQIALEVSDSGIGIPADQLEHIFGRFYQVDGSSRRKYGGVGLGLALVKEIAEVYGGSVTVESQVGEGSTFTVLLPIATAAETSLSDGKR